MANHFSLARESSRTGHARAIGHRFEVGALSCVAAFFFSVYLELFYEAWKGYQGVQYDGLLASSISLPVLLRVGALFLVGSVLKVGVSGAFAREPACY